jgi:hypothetical protein
MCPWRSAIAALTVEADNKVPSAHSVGAGGVNRQAITRAVMSCRNGMPGRWLEHGDFDEAAATSRAAVD